jgi:7-carboxy-7-deazaguanine synthase
VAELHDEIQTFQVNNVCFTGGEPFLQSTRELEMLTNLLWNDKNIECFSNGTLAYPEWAVNRITFCMDWKLPSSGEDCSNEMRYHNVDMLGKSSGRHAIKFVVANEDDLELAEVLYDKYIARYNNIDTYVGVVWGKMEEKVLAEWLVKSGMPWKMNVQVHNYIWDRTQRGI